MAQKKRGLGRGLGALIPTAPEAEATPAEAAEWPQVRVDSLDVDERPSVHDGPAAVTTLQKGNLAEDGLRAVPARFRELDPEVITPNPRQPRQVFDDDAMAELVHSIREIGLLQPIVVRPTEDPDHFELVAGERRLRASQRAGLATIPAIVRDTPDDELLRDALLENLHRADLNPLEEAAAYQQLLDDFDCTQEQLATRIGRSRPQVSNTIRLLRLPAPVARRVAAGVLSAGHARAILALDDDEAMERLATRVVAEGLSVRATEEIVAIGDGDGRSRPTRRTRRARSTPVEVVHLVERLSEQLETRVTADVGRNRGRLIIDFASLDDLRRIVDVIDNP